MILTHFAYSESGWFIDRPLPLQPVNLLVGKNSAGKSKTIRSLGKTVAFLLQQFDLRLYEDFDVMLSFEDEGTRFWYSFSCKSGVIEKERLKVGNQVYLERNGENALLHEDIINPPSNKLVLHVRRDTVQYPYIEKIMAWAERACGISFNEIDMAGDNSTSFRITGNQQKLYDMVKSLPAEGLQHVMDEANKLGYPITRIRALDLTGDFKKVLFRERNVENALLDKSLSKGMFRTLYILIYIEYISRQELPSLLMIDDLCEGLDYDRSISLGKLLFEFCKLHDIQLVASSNDTFLMDAVDLEYWNIIQRNGSKILSVNIQDNPTLFHDFRFTGLSNSDFISTDYISRHLSD